MLPELITAVPGPRSLGLAAKLRRNESRNVTYLAEDFPIFWDRAKGTNVWDADGNRFLDLTSAFGVAGLGHNAEPIRAALVAQSAKLLHGMGDVHPTELKAELCARLSALTFERWGAGSGKVVLGNSGSDAVEIALKTSLLHSGKPGVIAFRGSYHGLGMGALATTGLPFFRDPFRSQLKEFTAFLPFPHCSQCPYGIRERFRLEGRDFPNCSTTCLEQLHDELEQTIQQREIGCILVEPVQGRGGCVVPPRDFLPMLRTICDTHKILLIADEIYTGFNRTGALFACEHFGIVPDLICLGKALTGGLPVSACVGRADVMDAWPLSEGEALHTSTFLGNPLGCAMALASLEEHAKPETAARVRERGRQFHGALRKLQSPHLGQLRGLGLMLGLELVQLDGSAFGALGVAIMKRALQDGLILLPESPSANVLSFCPPFEISDNEIAFVVARLQEYLTFFPGSIS
ncbi:MAG TPA: aspartate aminotransferase family protein [Chthoniobacteraceae bacterium]|jgi:4-aminobutyrate aminotransferase-like enzyme